MSKIHARAACRDPTGSGASTGRWAQPEPFDELSLAALAIEVTLSAPALDRCKCYVETLLLWRQRLSLTSAKTAREIVLDHILDSLHLVPFLKAGCRVADIGSGAGFPGVPLAIACPQASFVLVESRRKRANFLREVARRINLLNVEVVEKRAEELRLGLPQPFDLVVSRAVGPPQSRWAGNHNEGA
jgi:16S rRNA (guanine527-N7)-methyltransferase